MLRLFSGFGRRDCVALSCFVRFHLFGCTLMRATCSVQSLRLRLLCRARPRHTFLRRPLTVLSLRASSALSSAAFWLRPSHRRAPLALPSCASASAAPYARLWRGYTIGARAAGFGYVTPGSTSRATFLGFGYALPGLMRFAWSQGAAILTMRSSGPARSKLLAKVTHSGRAGRLA